MNDHLVIFDTTLRDGEQSPGASMTKDEKLRVARQLERMRVDVIEAGFAAASPGDFDAIHTIAQSIRESTVCSLARANENDIRRAGEAIKPAASGRIHTFIATSQIHLEKKLRKSQEEVIGFAVEAVKRARGYCEDVEFSTEDAARTSPGESPPTTDSSRSMRRRLRWSARPRSRRMAARVSSRFVSSPRFQYTPESSVRATTNVLSSSRAFS